ncbi:MAG: class II fructose-bisphosphate aldolase [Actinomycetia bacterium]|nr:class II fructose-bisphosphate aldolase [Actinomycetes bacterium]
MSLISLKELLNDSKQKKYGVFATNAFTFEMAEIIVRAAEEKKSPIILMMAEDLFPFLNPQLVGSSLLKIIENSKVPIVFHLDHGNTFNIVLKSMEYGFNSVMYDGSSLELDENILAIKKLKEKANPLKISVEGEVGQVRGLEGKKHNIDEQKISASDFTKVEDAVKFVDETNVDALAVAVGTIHGKFRFKPQIDFERIKKLKDSLEVPLVLHGSSGLSDDDFRRAIKSGITKINYFTGLVDIATKETKKVVLEDDFSYLHLNKKVLKSVKEAIMRMLDVFGSSGKA